jgi:hypothetical protein
MERAVHHKMTIRAVAATLIGALISTGEALAQPQEIFCQPIECGTFRVLDDTHKSQLQDPFFRLVLAPRPDVRKLADIEALIMGTEGQRRFFVVSEEIKSSVQPASRRAVIDFVGKNGTFNLSADVFLSFSFNSMTFPEVPDLEVLAWDEVNGVYNFYKLDREGAPNQVWKLAATSRNVDTISPQQRAGTCLACHASGVPVMKELRFPWNNWHSGQSRIDYLQQTTAPERRWPVVANPHFSPSTFFLGEDFEKSISAAIGRSNSRRFEQLIIKQTDRKLTVADARRVLRPLFETTEVNLVSAGQQSGLHPLSGTTQVGPSQTIKIPNSFFLMSSVLGSAGVNEANEFQSVAIVQPTDYRALIENSGVRITSGLTGRIRGDTHFSWFTPEQGFVASNWIATLIENGVVSKAFVAAVAAADLETPVFSKERAMLLKFVPASFTAIPGEQHPDTLTRAIITALETSAPAPGSVAAQFLATLKATDPVAVVRSRVEEYKNRIAQRLGPNADAPTHAGELQRLFAALIDRRKAMIEHPLFGNLIESEALLPMP